MNNNNNSRYTFGIGHARTCPSIPPTSRINVGCVYLENFQNIFTSYKEQERENCEHCRATGHKINPHNVKGLSEGKRVIKRRVKKAIAIDQRKPSVSSDELGMDLSAISNPIVWKYVTVFSYLHYVHTWLHLTCLVKAILLNWWPLSNQSHVFFSFENYNSKKIQICSI